MSLSTYNLNLTLANIRSITVIFLDILIMWVIFYNAIRLVRGSSRTMQLFKGILLIIIIDGIAKFIGLKTLEYFADIFLNWGFLAVIIIFQQEIRNVLEQLGKSGLFSRMNSLTGNEKENLVDQIVKATMLLSKDQTGALISIEQSYSLEDFIQTGTRLNSDVTAELLTSIFVTSTPLHDGAVIIQGMKIACASAYFPPTNLELPSRYGARHRAAIGISEISDAVTVVVSEETGAISITERGKIYRVTVQELRDHLMRVICGEETEVSASGRKKNSPPGHDILIEENIYSDEVTLPKEKGPEKPARTDTGMLSRIMLKKQTGENTPAKIEVEEVVLPEEKKEEGTETVIQEPEPETNTAKHGLFGGLFSHHGETEKETEKIRELEEELDAIKLPKKKERPAPSYPEQENSTTEPSAEAEAAEDVAEEESEEAENYRMSPEEVRLARERSLEKLMVKKPEVPAPVEKEIDPYENEDLDLPMMEEEPGEPEEKIYDTTKLDISRLMGFDDDFDSTFRMVDHLDTNPGKKGGDRK